MRNRFLTCWRSMVPVCVFVLEYTLCQQLLVQHHFFQGSVCDVAYRVSEKCSVQVHHAGSLLQCAAECGLDRQCVGASLHTPSGACYTHYQCPALIVCSRNDQDTDHEYVSKQCANDGQFNPDDQTCQCENPWNGPTCQNKIYHCRDLLHFGYPAGSYQVTLNPNYDAKTFIDVICDIYPDSSEVKINLFKHDGDENLNRTWKDYNEGFWMSPDNYWIGFEKWQILSDANYNSLIVLLDFGDEGTLIRKHTSFQLYGETYRYSYNFNNSTTLADGKMADTTYKVGNCFFFSKEIPFSTVDSYNSALEDNCPAISGYAWWFTGCNPMCNLFGAFGQSASGKLGGQRLDVIAVPEEMLLNYLKLVRIDLEV